MQKQCENNGREKSNGDYSLSIRVKHIRFVFYHNNNDKDNNFFRARAELTTILIDNGKLANQIARLAAILVKNFLTVLIRVVGYTLFPSTFTVLVSMYFLSTHSTH